jgi:hypothetical protein
LIQEKYTPEALSGIEAEAHYHLGRVLCEGELDFDGAVSELEQAVAMDPQNVPALYHLGQAIRAQVERNKLKRVEELLRDYLFKGAPLGHEDEVREFLGSRRQTGTR